MTNTSKISSSANTCLRVLRAVADHPEGVGITQLARELDIGKSSIHMFLATLASHGFVERQAASSYRLGMTAFEVGSATPETARFGGPVLEPMRRLADLSGEAVTLAVLSGQDALMVQRFETAHILRAEIRVGTRMPLTSCASGKFLLAHMDDAEVDALLPEERLPATTPHSERSKTKLRRGFATIRERGWATNDEEFAEGITGIATGVHGRDGNFAAALSIAGPTMRFEPESWVDDLLRTAAEMNQLIAARP
ncbi:MAG: helix-turn-helix domain-containing protein [Streptosporangiales bacterium]|nr:helix-turn-helix domain-containing protein [Streptosporangiales bacterium]